MFVMNEVCLRDHSLAYTDDVISDFVIYDRFSGVSKIDSVADGNYVESTPTFSSPLSRRSSTLPSATLSFFETRHFGGR